MDFFKFQYCSKEEIRTYQEQQLAATLEYVSAYSPYYGELFQKERINISDIRSIDDLQRIPVTTKQDIQSRSMDFLCVPSNEVRDYVTTSGTLGEPVTFAETENDLRRLALSESISYELVGCTKDDILQLMCTIDRCFMAGQASMLGSIRLGSAVIRTGNGVPELQWNTINRIHPSACICVPSFLIRLVDYAEAHGIDYHHSSLKKAICVGEAIRTNEHKPNLLGEKIQSRWPEISLYGNYASTEMQSSFNECVKQCGAHHKPNLTIVEFLDEDNNPAHPDDAGEITITTLGVEGMPLLRFKTGDVCHRFTEQCACGRNSLRIGPIIGRKGQMIKYKGTTLYPAALYDVLDDFMEIENYIVEVYTNKIGTDGIRILIGSHNNSDGFMRQIKDVFRSKIRVAPDVVFEPAELIARKQMPPTSRKLIKFFDYR